MKIAIVGNEITHPELAYDLRLDTGIRRDTFSSIDDIPTDLSNYYSIVIIISPFIDIQYVFDKFLLIDPTFKDRVILDVMYADKQDTDTTKTGYTDKQLVILNTFRLSVLDNNGILLYDNDSLLYLNMRVNNIALNTLNKNILV